MTGCSSFACTNRSENGFKMYRIPQNPQRRQQWLQNMRRASWTPTNSSVLCEVHFEATQFEQNRQDRLRKLKPNAVPTLFDSSNPPPLINRPSRKSIYKGPLRINNGKKEPEERKNNDQNMAPIPLPNPQATKDTSPVSPISNDSMSNGIVQYIVVRSDLLKELGWPVGAVIAQACHAVTAVTHLFYDDDDTQEYLKDLNNMHKVVLEATNESSLIKLKDKLVENDVKHKLWIEQPENIPTCLVAKPYPKDVVQKYFKKFKLFKV